MPYFKNLGESLIYEDERDEDGETFLGESGDVPDERAQVEGNDDEQRHHDPDTDPEPEGHEMQSVLTARFSNTGLHLHPHRHNDSLGCYNSAETMQAWPLRCLTAKSELKYRYWNIDNS